MNDCFWLQAWEPRRNWTAEICFFYLVLFTLTSLVLFRSFIYYFFIHICFGFETKLANGKLHGELRPSLWYNLKEWDWIFRLPRQIWWCGICILKLVIIFLKKHLYEWVYKEEFFNKTDAFPGRLQQRFINKINIWWSSSRLSLCLIWSYNTYIFRNS